MRIAALMPLKIDPEKSLLYDSLIDASNVCDEVIILWDGFPPNPASTSLLAIEHIFITGGNGVWDDRANRMALLARACKYNCDWVMWLDDDERLGPTLTSDRIEQLCTEADSAGHTAVITRVRTAWDWHLWRTDGIFGVQRKPLLVKNPLMLKDPNFKWVSSKRLHALPRLDGAEMLVDDYIVHFGMRTRALREKNVKKYLETDPKQEFTNIRYDYLLNEEGATYEPL